MEKLEQPNINEEHNVNENLSENTKEQTTQSESAQKENQVSNNCSSESSSNGSNLLGKFKDIEDLKKAYNNLQAEFTRKCQRLKELEKQEDILKEDSEAQNLKTYDAKDSTVPIYLKEDFEDKLQSFLSENPNAKLYAKEISGELIKDEELDLQGAYNKVLASKYKEPYELLKDKEFVEKYVLQDEDLKKELLKKYIKEVEELGTPKLISGYEGMSAGAKDIKISTLEEANNLAFKMFKNEF